MKNTLLAIFLFLLGSSFVAEKKYPVALISEELKTDANAVVRENHIAFKILAKNKAVLNARYVITILNSKGNGFASRSFGYDKLTKITELHANVYDANGELIKKLKSSEIVDHSSYDGFSLFSDFRLKSVDLTQASFPYTVEYEYETEYKYLYSVPGIELLPTENVSAERITYQVTYPPGLEPRFKQLNLNKEPKRSKTPEGIETVSWVFENIKPMRTEPMGPSWDSTVPQIMAGPTVFEYDGYAGNMASWESYGKWQLQLNDGRDALTDATKQKVKQLTQGLTTTEQKTKVLYEYLQSKTRYVSIQEGIGGVQPFSSQVVEETSYGDCKALSNFMVALLKEAGIKGYYTKIRAGAGEDEIVLDFPSHQTNHIVVGVPNGADTLWLECTSQTNPFGYMGRFTGGRSAIMVTEKGGQIVKTPRYELASNRQLRAAHVFVEQTGDAKAKVATTYTGLQYENGNLDAYLTSGADDQKKWLQKNTNIPSFDIANFAFEDKKGKVPAATVRAEYILKRLASVSGKRLFLAPNLMNRSTFVPEKLETRKTKLIRKFPYEDIDSIRYHIPENLYPESLPPPFQFKSRFGEYESSFKVDQGDVLYIRKVRMFDGEYPPDTYQELIDFYKNMNKADHVKVVFLNKT